MLDGSFPYLDTFPKVLDWNRRRTGRKNWKCIDWTGRLAGNTVVFLKCSGRGCIEHRCAAVALICLVVWSCHYIRHVASFISYSALLLLPLAVSNEASPQEPLAAWLVCGERK